LPYLKPAKVATKQGAKGDRFTVALQLVPRPTEKIVLSHPPELVPA